MAFSRVISRRLSYVLGSWLLLVGACATAASPSSTTSTSTTITASPAVTETTLEVTAETVVTKDLPYYESADGTTWLLDVYHPSVGAEYPLVVLYHGNPVFGQDKDSVRTLATMIADRGAVVVVPNWGNRMSMGDMHAIAREFEVWITEQGPCAVWAAVELAESYGASDAQVTLVGVTTGVMPAQAATFDRHPTVEGCLSEWVLVPIDKSILFDTDWLLVPSIWDEVLADNPTFLEASSYWHQVNQPMPTRILMLVGEITAPETNRSLEGKTYAESEWVRIRDPNATFASAFAASGTLEDGSMSFADVTHVVVNLLAEGGWDAQMLVVPGVAHAITGQPAQVFVADLVFAD